MPDLWTPVTEGPHEAFVERLHRTIAQFAEAMGVETPVVEIELADTSHFVLDRIELLPPSAAAAPEHRERLARVGRSLPPVADRGAEEALCGHVSTIRPRSGIRHRVAATSHGATISAITSNQT